MQTKLEGRKNKCVLLPQTLYGDEKSVPIVHNNIVYLANIFNKRKARERERERERERGPRPQHNATNDPWP